MTTDEFGDDDEAKEACTMTIATGDDKSYPETADCYFGAEERGGFQDL